LLIALDFWSIDLLIFLSYHPPLDFLILDNVIFDSSFLKEFFLFSELSTSYYRFGYFLCLF